MKDKFEDISEAIDVSAADLLANDRSLQAPSDLDFDQWKADGFPTVALAPASEREGIKECIAELASMAAQNPKSEEAEVWKLVKDLERLQTSAMKALTKGGWRPPEFRGKQG